jgi:Ca2+-binding EF-hand superfamily protein
MRNIILAAAAAASLAVIAPAIAQTAPEAHRVMSMQPMTRAQVVDKVQTHFAKLDSNKDGFVTKEEAQAVREARRVEITKRVQERGDQHFDRMDANHDGSISRQEFDSTRQAMISRGDRGHRVTMRAMHGGMMGNLFDMADANKDSRVSLQEATAAAVAHFDAADLNHDGTLTPEEMRAAHQAMRGKPAKR